MSEKHNILIVDDESFYTDVLVSLLGDQYNIITTNNGIDALKIAEQTPQPDLILLDIVMEKMDGYEVCRRLKLNKTTQEIPVIFLTVKRDVDDEVLGFDLGAVDYITKPMSPAIVRARVRTHLEIVDLRNHLKKLIAEK